MTVENRTRDDCLKRKYATFELLSSSTLHQYARVEGSKENNLAG